MAQETNYFLTLSKVKCVVEKRKSGSTDLSYISWAEAWSEVKKNFPDSTYKIYETSDGFPFWSSIYGIDVKVGVTITGIEHIVRLPVMDGNNNAMKTESYTYKVRGWNGGADVEKKVAAADAFDINKTIQRAFTKAIAMHGIGLYVYQGEDLPIKDPEEKTVVKKEEAPKAPAKAPAKAKTFDKPAWDTEPAQEPALAAARKAEQAEGALASLSQKEKLVNHWTDKRLEKSILDNRTPEKLNELAKSYGANDIHSLTPTAIEQLITKVIERNITYIPA